MLCYINDLKDLRKATHFQIQTSFISSLVRTYFVFGGIANISMQIQSLFPEEMA